MSARCSYMIFSQVMAYKCSTEDRRFQSLIALEQVLHAFAHGGVVTASAAGGVFEGVIFVGGAWHGIVLLLQVGVADVTEANEQLIRVFNDVVT